MVGTPQSFMTKLQDKSGASSHGNPNSISIYTNVAAVRKLIVGVGLAAVWSHGVSSFTICTALLLVPNQQGIPHPQSKGAGPAIPPRGVAVLGALDWVAHGTHPIYFEKIRVFKAGAAAPGKPP